MDQRGRRADAEFQSQTEMTRGETGTVVLAVTLDRDAPPAAVLGRAGAIEEEGLLVACVLEARLRAPTDRFSVDADQLGWQKLSLETRDTARWVWQLTPKATGSHAVSAELRPVVLIKDLDGTSRGRSLREADVATFETTVHVVLAATERPAWWMRWATGRVEDLASLLESLAVLVGAAGGLWFALRHFNKRSAGDRDLGTDTG